MPAPEAEAHGRALQQAAFRDLHAARLHGFCLLVSLGDRAAAASAAGEAMVRALPHLGELRHPERAAAWLRSAALASLAFGRPREPEAGRRETLRSLGMTDAAFDGMAGMDVRERAAFVAAAVERFEPLDVETILRTDAGTARRLVDRARRRYLAAAGTAIGREPLAGDAQPDAPPGSLTRHIEALAEAALGGTWSAR